MPHRPDAAETMGQTERARWSAVLRAETDRADAAETRVKELEQWVSQHEKCIERIQADQLLTAARENELHDQKDAKIATLTARLAMLHEGLEHYGRHGTWCHAGGGLTWLEIDRPVCSCGFGGLVSVPATNTAKTREQKNA